MILEGRKELLEYMAHRHEWSRVRCLTWGGWNLTGRKARQRIDEVQREHDDGLAY